MFSKCLKTFKSFGRNIGRLERTTNNAWLSKLPLVSVTAQPMRSVAISANLRNKDPFEELLKIIEHSSHLPEPKSNIFSKDPPISIKDLDGNQIEPIDIDAWKDPKELLGLFGNVDYFEKKVRSRQDDLITEPLDELTHVIHDEISHSMGNFKIENDDAKEKENVEETAETKQAEVKDIDVSKDDVLQGGQGKVLSMDSTRSDVQETAPDIPNEKKLY